MENNAGMGGRKWSIFVCFPFSIFLRLFFSSHILTLLTGLLLLMVKSERAIWSRFFHSFFLCCLGMFVCGCWAVRVRIDVSMKADTNLRHFGCRWKVAKVGRWLERDERELKEQQQPWQVVDSLTFHSMHSSAKIVDMLLSSLVWWDSTPDSFGSGPSSLYPVIYSTENVKSIWGRRQNDKLNGNWHFYCFL